jgi:hypothetical protein
VAFATYVIESENERTGEWTYGQTYSSVIGFRRRNKSFSSLSFVVWIFYNTLYTDMTFAGF